MNKTKTMKNTIYTLAFGLMLTACAGKPAETTNDTTTTVVDTLTVANDTTATVGGAGESTEGTAPTEKKK